MYLPYHALCIVISVTFSVTKNDYLFTLKDITCCMRFDLRKITFSILKILKDQIVKELEFIINRTNNRSMSFF